MPHDTERRSSPKAQDTVRASAVESRGEERHRPARVRIASFNHSQAGLTTRTPE
jgi:hypothetical protein